MEIDFKGKRALVTGAGKGIGRCIAKSLARCGAEVIALTRTQSDLDTLVAEVPSIHPLCLDVSKTEDVRKAIEKLGDIHLLVNNAGVSKLDAFLDIEPEDFDKLFGINVKAALFVAQAVAKKMVAKGSGGAIVNVSSQASQSALQDHTLYCSSKAALDMLTKMMAFELGKHKIRVNAVNPTAVMTDMGRLAWSDEAKAGPLLNRIPLGRFAEEEEVVNAILFLLSDKASMISGALLPVDGGLLTC
ncbi:D-erythrulose reductase-like [Actinia tenebrosa]|uniref:D-erythrulose reductase-like n=1 Tax=Actinia tenebrosa TaxID=6105 RepID=A0A6P8J5K9_ACTTE|nr:D-erythrulose reductase-like [Actinia tenebrosa]